MVCVAKRRPLACQAALRLRGSPGIATVKTGCNWDRGDTLAQLCCVPITSCKRCARLSQLCKPFHSRSHWEFPICTSGEVETVFLIQFAPLGKRWRRFTENLILSLFNFNFVQGASPRTRGLPMRRLCWCGGVVSRKKGARSMGEENKGGENNNNNNNYKKLTGKINMKKKEGKKYINNTHPCPILFRNHFMLGNNFGVFKVFIITVRLLLFIKNSFMN